MEIQTALENIKQVTHRIAEEEIICIRENREEAIPVLLEYVKAVIDLGEELPEDYDAHSYAMFLLAEFRVQEAFPYLIQYLELDRDVTEYLLGDLLCENFGSILASVAKEEDIPQIKSVAEKTELDLFHRLAAMGALQVLFTEDVYDRDSYFTYLRYLLETYQDDPEFSAFCVVDCEQAGFRELLPLIEKLYKQNLVEEQITDLPFVKDRLLSTDEISSKESLKQDDHSSFIRDTIKSVGWWACFKEKPDFGRKVGRNEPCPCGSGKKYKKCCGSVG